MKKVKRECCKWIGSEMGGNDDLIREDEDIMKRKNIMMAYLEGTGGEIFVF